MFSDRRVLTVTTKAILRKKIFWLIIVVLSAILIWWLFTHDGDHRRRRRWRTSGFVADKKRLDYTDPGYIYEYYQPANATWWAVFTATTPDGVTRRSFDYAFYLPLTALAWERIGFRSLVLIAGRRCEWDGNPTLDLILTKLEGDRKVSIRIRISEFHSSSSFSFLLLEALVIFMEEAIPENRILISQVSRLFAANFPDFPGKPDDFLITSDSDLWPLRRGHYVPRPGYDLVLLHSDCCGKFSVPWRDDKNFTMYPIGNIGAKVSTWQEIINRNGSTKASDSASILQYLEVYKNSFVYIRIFYYI